MISSLPRRHPVRPKGGVNLNSHANAAAERDLGLLHHLLANRLRSQEQLPHVVEGSKRGPYQKGQKLVLFAFLLLNGGLEVGSTNCRGIGQSQCWTPTNP